MSEKGFWGKLRQKLGQTDVPERLPVIEIPKIEMTRPQSLQGETIEELDAVFLRQQMSNHLDNSALMAIGDKFGVDFMALSGGKGRKVLELVNQIQQQGEVEKLLDHCQQIKSDVAWQLDRTDA